MISCAAPRSRRPTNSSRSRQLRRAVRRRVLPAPMSYAQPPTLIASPFTGSAASTQEYVHTATAFIPASKGNTSPAAISAIARSSVRSTNRPSRSKPSNRPIISRPGKRTRTGRPRPCTLASHRCLDSRKSCPSAPLFKTYPKGRGKAFGQHDGAYIRAFDGEIRGGIFRTHRMMAAIHPDSDRHTYRASFSLHQNTCNLPLREQQIVRPFEGEARREHRRHRQRRLRVPSPATNPSCGTVATGAGSVNSSVA